MKNILFSLFAFAAYSAFAAEPADTMVIRHPDNVIVVESPDSVAVCVTADGNSTVVSKQLRQGDVLHIHRQYNMLSVGSKWDVVSGGLMFGFVDGVGAPDAARFEMGKSFELGWLNIIALQRSLSGSCDVSLGVGIDWRNYRSTMGTMFVPADGRVSLSVFPPDVTSRYSRLKVFSLQFPLMFTKRFALSRIYHSVSLGVIFNWNSHGSVKSSWVEPDGATATFSSNDIGQRKFTIDFMAKVSLGGAVGLYVRYSPYKVLTSASSPAFRTLSAGLTFFY